MGNYILALDQGTTSSRAIVFDNNANFIPDYSNLFSPLFVIIAVIIFTST